MRAMPSRTSRTLPTSSTFSSCRSAASISRSRMSFISPGRSVVSEAMRSHRNRTARNGDARDGTRTAHDRGPRARGSIPVQIVKIITSRETQQDGPATPSGWSAPRGMPGRRLAATPAPMTGADDRRLGGASAPPTADREAPNQVDGAEAGEGGRAQPNDALRGAREVGGGRESEHARDVAQVVAGVLGQLGGRDEPHEIDHALQVWRARGREGATQMLARDAH